MINEIWKPVVGYEGLYEVSNLGSIRSLPRNGTTNCVKIMKQIQRAKHSLHLSVGLSKNNKQTLYFVHDLVAIAFIPNPNNYPIINHKDENPLNNCVDNLEWCTYEYNSNYGNRNKKITAKKSKPILQFSKNGEFIRKWESAMEVYNELGIQFTNIRQCIKGTRSTAGGFIWKCA